MNKEELLQLGLTEEQATAVSTALEAQQMIPKARFDEVNNAKKSLEQQVLDYDGQLKTLQKSAEGNETLQAEIKALQEAQTTAKAKYEQDLKDAKINAAIQLAINGKVHDVELAATLFDRSLIQISEDGKVTGGLEEQITSLQESKSYLFVPKVDPTPAPTQQPFTPVGIVPTNVNNQNTPQVSIGAQFAQAMNKATPKNTDSPW